MYRLMIADDETHIREGLAALIDWHEAGFEIVAMASDGEEALDLAKREKPDLILLDIRMPRLDGIAFLTTLREQGSNAHCIVLSGFAEFEYAQKATALQVDAYLLKPVDEDELAKAVTKVRERLEEEGRLRILKDSLDDRGYTLNAIFTGAISDPLVIHERLEALGLCLPSWQVLLVLPQTNGDPATSRRLARLLEDNQEKLALKGVCTREPWVCAFSVNVYRRGHNLKLLYASLAQILGKEGLRFQAAIGPVVDRCEDIKHSWDSAWKILSRHFFLNPDSIAWEEPFGYDREALPDGFNPDTNDLAEKIAYAISVHNCDIATRFIENAARWMCREGHDEGRIRKEFGLIASLAGDRLVSLSDPGGTKRGGLVDLLSGMLEQGDIYSLARFLSRRLPGLMSDDNPIDTTSLISRMKEIIERNYADNLKLESLADVFRYNSAYLGKLFKSQVGISFKTYLDQVRIQRAKELLEQGYRVYQVAEQVGFTYVDYFHAKFKKYTGLSPSAWRGGGPREQEAEE